MARKKSRRKAKAKKPVYMAPLIGLAAGLAAEPLIVEGIENKEAKKILYGFCTAMTGYHPYRKQWVPERATGAMGLGGGIVISKVASMARVNDRLPNIGRHSIRF